MNDIAKSSFGTFVDCSYFKIISFCCQIRTIKNISENLAEINIWFSFSIWVFSPRYLISCDIGYFVPTKLTLVIIDDFNSYTLRNIRNLLDAG